MKTAFEALKNRIQVMIGRCIVASVKDSEGVQLVQVTGYSGETLDGVEHRQNFGLAANPPSGSEGVLLSVGGRRSNPILIAVGNRQFRLKELKPGEVALYDAFENKIHLKEDGSIQVDSAKVVVNAADIEVNATTSLILGEGATEALVKLPAFQSLFDAHTHIGFMGVPTSPPTVPSTPAVGTTIAKGK